MGRFSKALNKAGYNDSLQQQDIRREARISESQLVMKKREVKQTDRISSPKIQRAQKTMSGSWDERLLKAINDEPFMPEIFKVLRSRILHPSDGKKSPQTIMITSAIPAEGKSFVAANLAVSFAQGLDQYALLVECDLRAPSVGKNFGFTEEEGIVDYLRDNVNLAHLIKKTSIKKLSLIPGGDPPVNPSELLSSAKMEKVVEELSSRYEDRIIIFDSPPVLIAAESSVLAEHVDGIILVVGQGKAGKSQVRKVVDLVGEEKILGLVFNGHSQNYLEKSIIKDKNFLYREYREYY